MQIWTMGDLRGEAKARLPTKEEWLQGSKPVSFAPQGSIFRMAANDREEYEALCGDVFELRWFEALEEVVRHRLSEFDVRVVSIKGGSFILAIRRAKWTVSLETLWREGSAIPPEAASCPKIWGGDGQLSENWHKSKYVATLNKLERARLGTILRHSSMLLAAGDASTLGAAFPPPARPGRPALPRAEMNAKLPFVPDRKPTPDQVAKALEFWRQEGYQLGPKSARNVLCDYPHQE